MAACDDPKIASCLQLLERAKTDNDKFAALLMVAKVTDSVDLKTTERQCLLDAIGMQFLIRLLKSKSVPEGCPANVYKVMSLSILSGLCTDPHMIAQTILWKSVTTLNEIIITNSEDEVDRQMIDNCYDIFQVFTQTSTGVEQLINGHVVPSLCTVIVSDLYGLDKAKILLQTLLFKAGLSTWFGHHDTLLMLLEHTSMEFDKYQDENKFKICKFLADVIRTVPEDMKESMVDSSWLKRTVKCTRDIFTSKLGEPQREPALELVAAVTENLGVTCLLPPHTTDSKLILIVTHLGCIETRMILENIPVNQIGEKANLLCSCYQLLECIINHMTTAPSLMLDDQQVLQLHAAMTGAFNAVIFFLKELSEMDTYECPVSVVIATLRVLGAWLAEETSALREKIYEILPFLIRMCKSNFEENRSKLKKVSFQDKKTKDSSDEMKKWDNSQDAIGVDGSHDMDISDKMADCDITMGDKLCQSKSPDSEKNSTQMEHDQNTNSTDVLQGSEELDSRTNQFECDTSKSHDSVISISCDKTDRVDVMRFMLPGLCHLTAEDKPRQILLTCKLQKLLEQYFRWCWNLLQLHKSDIALQGSMETLCNVFLNLAVTEPNLATEDKNLHDVTLLIMEAVPLMDSNTITLKVSMITLGLMLLRQQAIITDLFTKSMKIKFFTSVMLFIKGVHTYTEVNNVKTLTVTDTYVPVWEEIFQLWLLSLQALKSCISIYSEIEETMLTTGLIPYISKLFISVQGKGVTDDIKDSMLSLLATAGANSSKVSEVIKSTGGQQLARMYKFQDLAQIANSSS